MCIRDRLNVGQLAAAIAERRESTVAELDGRIAGFANFYQWQHGEFCALGNLMVAPWARSRDVAQYLVEVMETLARQRYKAPLMKVSCFNANAGGLLLYTRLGYRTVGIVERRAPDAVSYTHLDVYKRQESRLPGRFRRPAAGRRPGFPAPGASPARIRGSG